MQALKKQYVEVAVGLQYFQLNKNKPIKLIQKSLFSFSEVLLINRIFKSMFFSFSAVPL